MRLIELTAALSLATDLGTGQPMEHALRSSLLAVRAADALGVTPAERSAVLYASLLRFLGCTSDASATAALVGGEEIAFNAAMAPVVMADDREALPHLIRHAGAGAPLRRRVGAVAGLLSDPGGKARSLRGHCEVGSRLAGRVGLPAEVVTALAHAYERWDGKGLPAGLAAEDIPLAVRLAVVARDVDLGFAADGWPATAATITRRRGRAYAPDVVDAFVAGGQEWLDELAAVDPWDAVVSAEPAPVLEVDDRRLDDVLAAFADFADLKSPYFIGHSRSVSALAGEAAAARGLGADGVERARRAGLVHDLGVVGVPAGVWNRAGPLTSEGRERVHLHAHVSERILARSGSLSELASDAGAHHERADGSGYHRGSRDIGEVAELVAAADEYCALREVRPYRLARSADEARQSLSDDADAGRFRRTTVDAVLAAAGHAATRPHVERPAGLTEREVDVLRLIARGSSNKDVAKRLAISPKTVGTHLEHIYLKANVTTRAGATLFAAENNLLTA